MYLKSKGSCELESRNKQKNNTTTNIVEQTFRKPLYIDNYPKTRILHHVK